VDGQRVQTLPGEQPFFTPSGELGDTQALLIVAVANNAPLEDFPVSPEVQGWWSGSVTLSAPEPADTADSGTPGPAQGCGGCSGGLGGGSWMLGLLALRFVRRR
jgi:hypothetical protein